MIELIKAAAESHFKLTKQDIGDYSELKGRGMRFTTILMRRSLLPVLALYL